MSTATEAVPRTPDDPTDRVLAIIAGLLPPGSPVDPERGLREIGLGSLAVTRLWFEVRRTFGVDLTVPWLTRCETVQQLVDRVVELCEAGAADPETAPTLQADPDARHAPFSLSDLQQAYLVGKDPHLGPDPIGCHVYREFEVPDVDVDRLVASWWRVVDRHDALRLVLTPDGRQRIRQVLPRETLPVHDRRTADEETFAAHVAAVRTRLSHHRYEPDSERFWTVEISLGPHSRAVVHLSIDVLIIDGHGLSVVLADWSDGYARPDEPRPQVELTVRDCLATLAAQRRSPEYQRQLRYWDERLADLPDGPVPAKGPTDPPSSASLRRTPLTATVPAPQWSVITRLARDWDVSPTALVFTLFVEAFVGQGAEAPFSIVLTTSDRMWLPAEAETTVGPFTSSITVPVPDTAQMPLREAAQRIHQQLWTDLEHAVVPGVTALRRRRAADRTSPPPSLPVVFTSMLGVGARPEGDVDFERAISYAVSQTSGITLDHQMWERDGALHVRWDVIEHAFPAGAVRVIFARFLNSLEALTDRPAQSRAMNELQQAYFVPRAMSGPAPWDGCQVYHSFHVEELDPARLESAWLRLIAAHEVLRTVVDHDGRLAVNPTCPGRWHIPVVDLDEL
ncbi:MAG TPA: condensation domain-containing protein, partial [Micromonosporaceae bacterium]